MFAIIALAVLPDAFRNLVGTEGIKLAVVPSSSDHGLLPYTFLLVPEGHALFSRVLSGGRMGSSVAVLVLVMVALPFARIFRDIPRAASATVGGKGHEANDSSATYTQSNACASYQMHYHGDGPRVETDS